MQPLRAEPGAAPSRKNPRKPRAPGDASPRGREVAYAVRNRKEPPMAKGVEKAKKNNKPKLSVKDKKAKKLKETKTPPKSS